MKVYDNKMPFINNSPQNAIDKHTMTKGGYLVSLLVGAVKQEAQQ